MGARAMQADSMLGAESFIPNATSAAEGDNTVMELKIVQDIVRGRTAQFPLKLMARIAADPRGRIAIVAYITSFGRAMVLQKKSMQDGQVHLNCTPLRSRCSPRKLTPASSFILRQCIAPQSNRVVEGPHAGD
jgi:hypothetical protein